ncbi:hypothetical protein D9M71_134380 [compost metagenome]
MVTNAELQHADIHHTAGTVHADHFAEVADRLGGVTTAAIAGQGRHARIVPPAYVTLVHQLFELALAGDGVVQVQAGKFVLARLGRDREVVQEPFVKRAVILELQGADGVSDALDGIRLAMGEVIARVDAPLVTGLVMVGMADAIEDRITQVHVRRSHIDLRAQRPAAIRELAGLHAGEQVEVLFHGAVAEGAVPARLGEGATVLAHFFRRQVADERLASLDQLDRPLMQLVEVAGGITNIASPLETQPLHVALDGVDVLLVFLGRVGVVEAQVAVTAELLGQAEVQADRLGMADVQVTIGLRRETGNDLGVLAGVQIRLNDLAQEVGSGGSLWLAHGVLRSSWCAAQGRPAKSKRLS